MAAGADADVAADADADAARRESHRLAWSRARLAVDALTVMPGSGRSALEPGASRVGSSIG